MPTKPRGRVIRRKGKLPMRIIRRPGGKTIKVIKKPGGKRIKIIKKKNGKIVRKVCFKKVVRKPKPKAKKPKKKAPKRPIGRAITCMKRSSAKQSSTWKDKRVKAFNPFKTKRFNARWGKGAFTCTHTLNDPKGAWWQVGFYGTPTITRISILNRADCCGGRINNAKVFVG